MPVCGCAIGLRPSAAPRPPSDRSQPVSARRARSDSGHEAGRPLAALFPLFQHLRSHRWIDFYDDIVTATLLVSRTLAHSLLAGLPPQLGIYAAIVPTILCAVLGSSRMLAVALFRMLRLARAGRDRAGTRRDTAGGGARHAGVDRAGRFGRRGARRRRDSAIAALAESRVDPCPLRLLAIGTAHQTLAIRTAALELAVRHLEVRPELALAVVADVAVGHTVADVDEGHTLGHWRARIPGGLADGGSSIL
ncbi:MAG: SulP family inorganic anion transporter [Panacagrimonas sp.]